MVYHFLSKFYLVALIEKNITEYNFGYFIFISCFNRPFYQTL